ncbi:uncharacterized protein LOC142357122 [Convolutriloba macropyga]|uniref:uncharacterized protein LOC142357122 n=1 Tax=Convolutriloba macropyga TaxID=536237 RepID=UPI003F520DC5
MFGLSMINLVFVLTLLAAILLVTGVESGRFFGTVVGENRAKWMASLHRSKDDVSVQGEWNLRTSWYGVGVLYNNYTVIGSATVGIKVGDLVKTGNNDVVEGFDNQTRQVKSVHRHPGADHNVASVRFSFDLAVVCLNSTGPIPGTSPVQLPDKNNTFEHAILEAFGWGDDTVSHGFKQGDKLHSVYFNTTSNQTCFDEFHRYNGVETGQQFHMVCAVHVNASAGPGPDPENLASPACLRESENDDSESCELVGLFKMWTTGLQYRAFIRVSAHVDWIETQAALCAPPSTQNPNEPPEDSD